MAWTLKCSLILASSLMIVGSIFDVAITYVLGFVRYGADVWYMREANRGLVLIAMQYGYPIAAFAQLLWSVGFFITPLIVIYAIFTKTRFKSKLGKRSLARHALLIYIGASFSLIRILAELSWLP